jgi:diguanylate cyclase (GGDEF)-like protein
MLMMQRMTHAGQRTHAGAAVLFADLDNFKQVNDVHGHEVGDDLLIAVAARLLALLRPGDTLARLSGDEFLFLCEDLSASGDAEELAIRIDQAFEVPFLLPHADISITASVGVAYSGPGQAITPALIRDADSAMYAAKRYRKTLGPAPEGAEPGRRARDLIQDLTKDLPTALSSQGLQLAYQPIVRTADGRIVGVETLLRWDHPARGTVPAPQTVALAEHAGLIAELGDWIIRRGCEDRAGWPQDDSSGPLELGVNLSAVQLLNHGLVRTIQDALADLSVDPATIVVEITESVLIQDGPRALVVLESLKELGLRIALDDFGSGYSSLTHLYRFPVDIVKIDRSFVEHVMLDGAATAIVRAVTNLAHELGMWVVAVGAQTQGQVERLNEIGCDSAQGYYFARPMSATDVGTVLEAHPAATVLPAL